MTAAACTIRLGDTATGLLCVLPAGHAHGHVYQSTTGQAHCPKEGI